MSLVSEKTVGLLTRIRELCENLAEVGVGENVPSAMIGTAECMDVLTDIMKNLLVANGFEQKALAAQQVSDLGDEIFDRVRRMCAEMEKEETVN